jgi:hypothetical protein
MLGELASLSRPYAELVGTRALDARSQAHSTGADKGLDKGIGQSSFPWRTVAREKQPVLRTITTV